MGTPQKKEYKRSWKNLLLNKRYQLRFTLFMVGVSTLLMLGLGYWVLSEAADATKITRNDVENRPCEPKQRAASQPSAATPPVRDTAPAVAPMPETGPATEGAADEGAKVDDTGSADGEPAAVDPNAGTAPDQPDDTEAETERPPREIEVEIGEMQIDPTVLEDEAASAPGALTAQDLARCKEEKAAQLEELDAGYTRIKIVLVAFGLLLVLGLTVFGIKMTHRVAGPLYKVTLYFDKMRDGTYDQVYPLRKGDQLIEFYDQFREAHAGLQEMERQDIAVLEEVLAAADEAQLANRSPELAQLVAELQALLERKKNSLS